MPAPKHTSQTAGRSRTGSAPAPSTPVPSAPATSTASTASAALRAAEAGDRSSQHRGAHLSVSGVSKSYLDRRVLSDVSFSASAGDRIGLIGENGTGKSTLLAILAGTESPDSGSVGHASSVGLLAQELPYPAEAPVSRVLDDAQTDALDALRQIETAAARLSANPEDDSAAQAYSDALEAAELSDAWAAEARRGEVLLGLGLGGIPGTGPVGELSGGQRLRLSLASLLLRAPHTLLLDEPSNHLDDDAVAYLERVLASWPGIVIVASHDRALLDTVSTRILDLDPLPVAATELADAEEQPVERSGARSGTDATAATGAPVDPRLRGHTNPAPERIAPDPETDDPGAALGVRVWGTGYSAARAARQAEMTRWRERYAAEQEELAALRHEIEVGSREVNRKHESKSDVRMARKFYADKDARVTARRARNARVRLEALERDRVRRPPEPLRFAGITAPDSAPGSPAPDSPVSDSAALTQNRDDGWILRADRVGLTGRLSPISLTVPRFGRVMLTGPNGAGKSTLLGILAGAASPVHERSTAASAPGVLSAPGAGGGILTPDTGSVERVADVRVGFLPQEVEFARPNRTAAQTYLEAVGSRVAEERPLFGTGLLARRDLDRRLSALSVGQRRRLALAVLVADPPDLLLLDEPTNHLSLTLVEELETALRDFEGAVVVASHDRWLRSRWEGAVVSVGA